jgi:hypothetical protein
MIGQQRLLLTLVELVDRAPVPAPPARGARGRPRVYADRLFLKALVISCSCVICTPSTSCLACWPNRLPRCANFASC